MGKTKVADTVSEETKEALGKIAHENPEKPTNDAGTKMPGRRFNPKYKNPSNIQEALERYPIHIVKLVGLLKSNGHICRYTSLAILNYLYQKGICTKNKETGKIGFVEFKWTKFKVNNNGLCTEYRYTEPFFLNCLIASFTSFANEAQKIIKTFCSKEYDEVFVQDDNVINEALAIAEQANADSGDDE